MALVAGLRSPRYIVHGWCRRLCSALAATRSFQHDCPWKPRWMSRCLSTKPRIMTLEALADYMLSKPTDNVIVMAGAGISTPSGLPDFRSPIQGLYDRLDEFGLEHAGDIFNMEYFYNNPEPFYKFAKEIYPWGNFRPNLVHYFVRLLNEKGMLLRMYTQNIDGLERASGLPLDRLIECHGNFYEASCKTCYETYPGNSLEPHYRAGTVPYCIKRKCKGIIKPHIVFFGETMPTNFGKFLVDFPLCDLLIVMGTSLEVLPFNGLVQKTRESVPRVLFNNYAPEVFVDSATANDVIVVGDVVEGVRTLCRLLGWENDLLDLEFYYESKAKKDKEKKLSAEETTQDPPRS